MLFKFIPWEIEKKTILIDQSVYQLNRRYLTKPFLKINAPIFDAFEAIEEKKVTFRPGGEGGCYMLREMLK